MSFIVYFNAVKWLWSLYFVVILFLLQWTMVQCVPDDKNMLGEFKMWFLILFDSWDVYCETIY